MDERLQNIHASVCVRGPNNQTVLVYDEKWMESKRRSRMSKKKDSGPAWKFPGGGCEYLESAGRWETPEETARRELYEEIGLVAKNLILLDVIDKVSHRWYLYEARFDSFDGLKSRGNDGEFVAKFPAARVMTMPNFLASHKGVAKRLGLFEQ